MTLLKARIPLNRIRAVNLLHEKIVDGCDNSWFNIANWAGHIVAV